ncbi:hypothetical protein CYMTET_50348 [Cymbomonas tetramitiformis]|uniref:Uncharacterized protein n=1 Tax=Cymbomonas tetramitiformis TaxID=36881 RepID=A0AAE0BPZ6_9CHLO|nr:hypothetical protein CYMTET_50348 [Cymbomonas tetramitiformis]
MWVSWDTPDVRLVLESLRDLVVGKTVSKVEWESVRFEILACFVAIAEPLKTVPQEVLTATRELVMLELLEEGAGSGPFPLFAGASECPLRGTWTSARAVAKKRLKGTVTLTHAQLMELLDAAVAKAAAAAGGAPGAPAGGANASGAEGQFRKALVASQGKRDGWSVERNKQVRASVLAEGAELREAMLRFRSEHAWKRPGTALEAHDFPELTWSRPMLEDEGCDIDELPAGEEASLEDWCVLVNLLRERVAAMQEFVRGKEPGATFEDGMDDSFARKRHRSPSPPAAAKRPHVDPADPTGAGGARGWRSHLVGVASRQQQQWGCARPEARRAVVQAGARRGWEVKLERQHRLMVYIKDWFQYRAMEYGVVNLIKFYEFLILQMRRTPR